MFRDLHRLIDWLIDLLTDQLIDWLIDLLTDQLIDWLIDLLTDQFIDWLIDCFIYWVAQKSQKSLENSKVW